MSKQSPRVDVTLVTHLGLPGGAPDDLLLAKSLEGLGVSVQLAPWNAPFHPWSNSALTIVRSSWDYHLHPTYWGRWIDNVEKQTRLINTPALLRWNTDKRYLLELQEAGIPCIRTFEVGADYAAWNDVVHTYAEWIIKPAIGASAKGVRRFSAYELSREGYSHALLLAQSGAVLLQPFVPEVIEVGERSLVFFGGEFSHAFIKPCFSANAAGTTAITRHQILPEELNIGQRVLKHLPEIPQYARVDLVPTLDGPLVMEVELIEPDLGLRVNEEGADLLARVLIDKLRNRSQAT